VRDNGGSKAGKSPRRAKLNTRRCFARQRATRVTRLRHLPPGAGRPVLGARRNACAAPIPRLPSHRVQKLLLWQQFLHTLTGAEADGAPGTGVGGWVGMRVPVDAGTGFSGHFRASPAPQALTAPRVPPVRRREQARMGKVSLAEQRRLRCDPLVLSVHQRRDFAPCSSDCYILDRSSAFFAANSWSVNIPDWCRPDSAFICSGMDMSNVCC
jgi:hypothetical protein